MQLLREKHDEELNSTKDNGTTENIKELDKLRQILIGKKGDVVKIDEEQYMLMEKFKALQQSFNEDRARSDK